MSSLQAIQKSMLQAVLAEQAAPLPEIRSDAIADANSRLEIYRHGYRIRLRDALKSEFTGLQCMSGAHFDRLLDHYVAAHPSEHYNIRWYGSGLASFLDYAHPWRNKPHFAEMARLDWAISAAFDAADEASIGMAELSAVPAESWVSLRLSLQDNLQMLACTHNVDAFRRVADQAGKRPRLRRFAEPRHIMIWRHAMTVHYRLLDDDEWQVLSAAIQGAPFALLCERLASRHGGSAVMPRMVALLQRWLEAGLIQSWQPG